MEQLTTISHKPFYFLRHGETEHNAKQIISNEECDVPLNSCGVKQAEAVRAHVHHLPIQRVYYSPLIRAKQTAEIVSQDLSYERMQIEELKECLGDIWLHLCSAPQENDPLSDSTKAFFSQVIIGINQCLMSNEVPLIVAHGGVHWALCSMLSIKNHPKAIGNCTLVHFNPGPDTTWTAKTLFPL